MFAEAIGLVRDKEETSAELSHLPAARIGHGKGFRRVLVVKTMDVIEHLQSMHGAIPVTLAMAKCWLQNATTESLTASVDGQHNRHKY